MTNVENYELIEKFLSELDEETTAVKIIIENKKEQCGRTYERKREFEFVRKIPTRINDRLDGIWRIKHYYGGMFHYYTLEEYRSQVWRRDSEE